LLSADHWIESNTVLLVSITYTTQDTMKFFILTAVLAACTASASSLVRSNFQNSPRPDGDPLAKCLHRLAFLVPWANWQPLNVAPAMVAFVSISHLVNLTAVVVRGMYNICNRFQITYIVNPLHHDSNIFGCNCEGGCRGSNLQSKQQSLESSKSYLCVESYFVIRRRSMIAFPERPVKPGG
jgi:hypothetical protein